MIRYNNSHSGTAIAQQKSTRRKWSESTTIKVFQNVGEGGSILNDYPKQSDQWIFCNNVNLKTNSSQINVLMIELYDHDQAKSSTGEGKKKKNKLDRVRRREHKSLREAPGRAESEPWAWRIAEGGWRCPSFEEPCRCCSPPPPWASNRWIPTSSPSLELASFSPGRASVKGDVHLLL